MSQRVHRVRVEVHNLRFGEGQEREGKSENHLTFALLLGNGKSVRFDMTPNTQTHVGNMESQYRNAIVSKRAIRSVDIDAIGCQNNFDPNEAPSQYGQGYSVGSFSRFIIDHQLDRYRFLYVDSQAMGCRYWVQSVMNAFRICGFLRADSDFSRGLKGEQPLSNILRCQWDRRFGRGHPMTIAPGIFLGDSPGSRVGTAGIAAFLEVSSLFALQILAGVLDSRLEHGDLRLRAMNWRFCTPESHTRLLWDLATTANLEGFEGMAAVDLTQASPSSFILLERFLKQRNILAAFIMRGVYPQGLYQQEILVHQRDAFVQMLTAVCSMAGAGSSH